MRHPIQPLVLDERGTLRFKANAIVRFLLDEGPFDMNDIARKVFTREDREQFAQLIGYSHSGAAELGYISDDVLEIATAEYEGREVDGPAAREREMRDKLNTLRAELREPIAALYGIHPDDLGQPEPPR